LQVIRVVSEIENKANHGLQSPFSSLHKLPIPTRLNSLQVLQAGRLADVDIPKQRKQIAHHGIVLAIIKMADDVIPEVGAYI
jgi:hypothetical protein